MKYRSTLLSASLSLALSGLPALSAAHPVASPTALNGIDTAEAPRVTTTVDASQMSMVAKTHFAFLDHVTPGTPVDPSVRMNHMQIVLQPSPARHAAMEAFIAGQHGAASATFHQWLSPQQFGRAFGVEDADIAAVTGWLTAQGFTVNNVYRNKTLIDFSGTVGQVNAALHTVETQYTLGTETRLSNASDISVPRALVPVIAGITGLNNIRPDAADAQTRLASWDAAKKMFVRSDPSAGRSGKNVVKQIISFPSAGSRGLAPNDLATMYGVRTLRTNGVTGKGVTIALAVDSQMDTAGWNNFVSIFNLGQYGGTLTYVNPQPSSGPANCNNPAYENFATVSDAEWTTAIAPGATVEVAACSDDEVDSNGNPTSTPATSNTAAGSFIAASNLIDADSGRPDILETPAVYSEAYTDTASKTAIDDLWAQADAEGISVFVPTGDSGVSEYPYAGPFVINSANGNRTIDPNALATSAHVTAVGGSDLADIPDGTTTKYFAPTPSAVGGSALSYVPEIAWNESCGNGVAATEIYGFSSVVAYCQKILQYDYAGVYPYSRGGGGGASSIDAKPAWQRQIYNAANDQSRDVPDVSLFAEGFDNYTEFLICTSDFPCTSNFSETVLSGGSSFSASMFAGIQALMDQGLAARGLALDQGNAAPTLYAIAAEEYGTPGSPAATLSTCSADNGATGTSGCIFHNVTRGSNSVSCFDVTPPAGNSFVTNNCYFYGSVSRVIQLGLTTTDTSPTSYGPSNKAYSARAGWSFSNGLGSVNATNLLIAWRALDNASSPTVSR